MQLAAKEQAGLVLVADKPFLVDASGRLTPHELEGPCFVFADDIEDESVLYRELETIANGILHSQYSETELKLLEEWSENIIPFIDTISLFTDQQHAEALSHHGHLN